MFRLFKWYCLEWNQKEESAFFFRIRTRQLCHLEISLLMQCVKITLRIIITQSRLLFILSDFRSGVRILVLTVMMSEDVLRNYLINVCRKSSVTPKIIKKKKNLFPFHLQRTLHTWWWLSLHQLKKLWQVWKKKNTKAKKKKSNQRLDGLFVISNKT